jgi:hypothetical protein
MLHLSNNLELDPSHLKDLDCFHLINLNQVPDVYLLLYLNYLVSPLVEDVQHFRNLNPNKMRKKKRKEIDPDQGQDPALQIVNDSTTKRWMPIDNEDYD